MPVRGVRDRLLDRIAELRGPLTWMAVIAGCGSGVMVGYLQSWFQGLLAVVSASGIILGFRIWANSRSRSAPLQAPRVIGVLFSPIARAIETGRARWWRRIVASALTKPDLSPATKLEIVDLLCGAGAHEPAAIADMLPWAMNGRVPAEVRLAIAVIAARGRVGGAVRIIRSLAEMNDVPFHVRFDAAEELLAFDEAAAERCFEALARSLETPSNLRLEAAAILSERSYQGLTAQQGPEVLALLVGDESVGPWVRIESCKLLRLHGAKRYQRALWSLANDSRLSPAQRLWCAERLADSDVGEGERGWTALAHDARLPFWARIDAAARLGMITEKSGVFALRALLQDPTIDERTKFDVVRKLTLLDLSQANKGVADCLCDALRESLIRVECLPGEIAR
ncbi:hypothetical protein SAMN05216270_108207 [Glycomyces harbinensis]|uniref:HEAT repeat-containing protein n=2 Tax=Glycomyces harbinensis TaxID=58114 RepID=A0A1G6Y927_9ACTN|nr:hypothetical protein SAMN05216270_108207 [Glycomyces harbinensis]